MYMASTDPPYSGGGPKSLVEFWILGIKYFVCKFLHRFRLSTKHYKSTSVHYTDLYDYGLRAPHGRECSPFTDKCNSHFSQRCS